MKLSEQIGSPIGELLYHATAMQRLSLAIEMAEDDGDRDLIAEQQMRDQIDAIKEELHKVVRALDEAELEQVMRKAA